MMACCTCYRAVIALAIVIPTSALSLVVTVGTNGATGVDYHSIQAAVNALDNVNPMEDSDPNSYHTILVQAGTYDAGDE